MNLSDPAMALLAASGGDTVKLFDVAVKAGDPCALTYTPSPGCLVNSVKWNHTNLVVASAGDDKKISLWRKNGQSLGTIPVDDSSEVVDEDGKAKEEAQYLLRRFNENLARRGPREEKKSSVQVAFGPGVMPSTSLKVYGAAKEENVGNRSASVPKSSDNGETLLSLPSAANEDGNDACSADPMETSAQIVKKEYRERWDYHHTNYPTTLPLRRPYSGDPGEEVSAEDLGGAAVHCKTSGVSDYFAQGDTLTQGMEKLQQTLADTVAAGLLVEHVASAMEKLESLVGFVNQADHLRQEALQQMYRMVTVRQAARGLLALGEYFQRLRALSSLWATRPREPA